MVKMYEKLSTQLLRINFVREADYKAKYRKLNEKESCEYIIYGQMTVQFTKFMHCMV